jgi:5-methylcytosine-specific restriction endonuclease McrA
LADQRRPGGHPFHQQVSLEFGSRPEITQSEPVTVKCTHCGKRTTVPRWFEKEGLELHFCGDRCRGLWRDDHRSEVKLKGNRDYRGGNWQTIARSIRERDAYRCRSCGISEETLGRQLDVHHVVPFRAFGSPDRANQPDNLISVCPSCHKKQEGEGHDDLPLFGKGEAPWR